MEKEHFIYKIHNILISKVYPLECNHRMKECYECPTCNAYICETCDEMHLADHLLCKIDKHLIAMALGRI